MTPLEPRAFNLRPGGSAEYGVAAKKEGVTFASQSLLRAASQAAAVDRKSPLLKCCPEGLTLPGTPECPQGALMAACRASQSSENVLKRSMPQLASGRRFNYMVIGLNPAEPAS